MQVRVDLIPKGEYQDVVVVIDTLRSCTVAPILFERGIDRLFLSPSLRASRDAARTHGLMLLGERRGLPLEGFNYGNSPAEFRDAALAGRSGIMVSENAPKVLPSTDGAKHVLLGSLYNADAVVRRALELATGEVALVCSGFAEEEDLDDTLTAGYLAARLRQSNAGVRFSGAATMAVALAKAFQNPFEALWQSRSGYYLRSINLGEDIAIASFVSISDVVPELVERRALGSEHLYRFERAPA